jgi:hypothetical protein
MTEACERAFSQPLLLSPLVTAFVTFWGWSRLAVVNSFAVSYRRPFVEFPRFCPERSFSGVGNRMRSSNIDRS